MQTCMESHHRCCHCLFPRDVPLQRSILRSHRSLHFLFDSALPHAHAARAPESQPEPLSSSSTLSLSLSLSLSPFLSTLKTKTMTLCPAALLNSTTYSKIESHHQYLSPSPLHMSLSRTRPADDAHAPAQVPRLVFFLQREQSKATRRGQRTKNENENENERRTTISGRLGRNELGGRRRG